MGKGKGREIERGTNGAVMRDVLLDDGVDGLEPYFFFCHCSFVVGFVVDEFIGGSAGDRTLVGWACEDLVADCVSCSFVVDMTFPKSFARPASWRGSDPCHFTLAPRLSRRLF